jgi:hypothetical protein
MSDMAGEAARVAVERCGSSRDTKLKAEKLSPRRLRPLAKKTEARKARHVKTTLTCRGPWRRRLSKVELVLSNLRRNKTNKLSR